VFAHGGRLRIESEPGRGTTVRVWLSCAEDAEAKSALEA
jgi:signal transduction histidine kinase